jgi:hypothetical protein
MPDDSHLFDVVIVDAGAGKSTHFHIPSYSSNILTQAGLQTATHLLRTKPSLRVLILERSSVSGGRIRNVRPTEGIEMVRLEAWRVDGSLEMTSELLCSHGIDLREWSQAGLC